MSDAKWCDFGKHAFSSRDMGAQRVTIELNVPDAYGRIQGVQQTQDVCGDCTGKFTLAIPATTENGDTKA